MMASSCLAARSQLWPQGCSQPHRGPEQVQAVRQGGLLGAGRWESPPWHPPGRSGLQRFPALASHPDLQVSRGAPGLGAPSLALECRGGFCCQTPTSPPDPRPRADKVRGCGEDTTSLLHEDRTLTDKWEKHLLFSVEDVRNL